MSVSGEGSGVAGTSYSLTCLVRLPVGVAQVSPNIQWRRLNMPFTSTTNISYTILELQATLQLPSLQSSDAGEYLCQASYSLGGYTSPLVNGLFTIDVTGKPTITNLFKYQSSPNRINQHCPNRDNCSNNN